MHLGLVLASSAMRMPTSPKLVRRLPLLAALCVELTCVATIAEAQEAAKARFTDKPLHLEARLGFGTLVGLVGVTAGVNAVDWLEIGVGAGAPVVPVVVGAYARFRPLYWATSERRLHALTVELGCSTGPSSVWGGFELFQGESDPRFGSLQEASANRADFAQLELGWETRSAGGTTIRFAGGVAVSIHGDWSCEVGDGYDVTCPDPIAIPTFTFGVGLGL
jgi:hypothetical protein